MKFALLIYQPHPFDPKALPAEEHSRIGAEYAELREIPGVTPGLPLGRPEDAVTVRVQDGQAKRDKGPYMGIAGAVGGFMIVEADSIEQAIDVAARVPAARLGGAIEIRPCEVYW